MPHTLGCRMRAGSGMLALLVAVEASAGCGSTPPGRLRVATSPQGAVTRLADLTLPTGTACLVTVVSGETVYGRLVSLTARELVLDPIESASASRRALADADITRVARATGRSKPARGGIGAAVGAVVSLPLSMSMVGDAMLIGALVGNFIGRRTGDSHLEVVLQR